MSQDRMVPLLFPAVRLVRCRKGVNELLLENWGEVGWAGNSGFHALNIALQFGARRIILVGFDMSLDHGLHWHGRHPGGLNNPKQSSVDKWRATLDAQAPALNRLGIEVVIGSPNSRLTAYPRREFMEAVRAACENSDQRGPAGPAC